MCSQQEVHFVSIPRYITFWLKYPEAPTIYVRLDANIQELNDGVSVESIYLLTAIH
jgi:hypothetical protein